MDPDPPGSALVPLLLLLAVPPPGGCCSFDFNPVSSTFSTHVEALTPWLVLDYPVAMPSNLETDSHCTHLWGLHFGAVALGRMVGVAGEALAPRLQAVAAHVAFVAECSIHDPEGCVRLETVNVSQLLGALVQHLGGLRGRPPNFLGCARLRCRPGPSLTPPAVQDRRTLGSQLGPPSPGIHGLVLLGGLVGALALAAAGWALWRWPCAQAGRRIGAAGEMEAPQMPPGGMEGPGGAQEGPCGGCDGTPQSHGETGGARPPAAPPPGP